VARGEEEEGGEGVKGGVVGEVERERGGLKVGNA